MQRMRLLAALAGVGLLTASAVSCAPTEPRHPVLTTLTVTLSPTKIEISQTTTATATGLDQDGQVIAVGAVSWSTSAESIARIGSGGVVTGLSAGTATITATTA